MSLWSKTTPPSLGCPTPRCAHNGSMIGKDLYVFGGWNQSRMLNDVYVFNTVSQSWSILKCGGVVHPRAGHSMNAVGHFLYVFGGGDNGVFYNDLQILDTTKLEWIKAYVAGTSPAARSRHSATLLGTNLFVFGGGEDCRLYNDLFILDTISLQWHRIETKGIAPSPRWGHTATLVDSKLYVFGGHDGKQRLNDLHVLNIPTAEWSQPKVEPEAVVPPPRAGHTADLVGKKIFMFGGGDGKVLSDLWCLDVDTLVWTQMNGTSPGRCAHSCNVLDGRLYIFGGGNGTKCFKDLYIWDAEQYLKLEEAKQAKMKNKMKVKQRLEDFLGQMFKNQEQHREMQRQRESKVEEEEEEGEQRGELASRSNVAVMTHGGIAAWLNRLGMERFIKNFLAEEIDMDVLPFVTEDHLKRIGVDTLGARLCICAAIEKLRSPEDQTPPSQEDCGAFEDQLVGVSRSLDCTAKTLTKLINSLTNTMLVRTT